MGSSEPHMDFHGLDLSKAPHGFSLEPLVDLPIDHSTHKPLGNQQPHRWHVTSSDYAGAD